MLASMCRITVILDFRSPLTAYGVHLRDGVDGRFGGSRFPSSTIQRAWHRIGAQAGIMAPPIRSKVRLKSLAAGNARRQDRRRKAQAPAASDTSHGRKAVVCPIPKTIK